MEHSTSRVEEIPSDTEDTLVPSEEVRPTSERGGSRENYIPIPSEGGSRENYVLPPEGSHGNFVPVPSDFIPLHLRPQRHLPPDQDCDDMEKIVVTPVYRGRLEESHERTRNAWRRRSWLSTSYNRVSRNMSAYIDNHSQQIMSAMTWIMTAISAVLVFMIAFQIVRGVRLGKYSHLGRRSSPVDPRRGASPDRTASPLDAAPRAQIQTPHVV